MAVTYQKSWLWHVQVAHDVGQTTVYAVTAPTSTRAEAVAVQAATDAGFAQATTVGSNRGVSVFV